MSNKKQSTKQEPPPTIITLTLPTPEGGGISRERATATLLIQRGDLAHIHQFHYQGALADLMNAIREAEAGLGKVEDNPPIIPESPKAEPKAKGKTATEPVVEEEPTIDIPLKKGVKAVKMSHLKVVGGETDAAAYRQAVLIAAKLIDGKLWDGLSPIRIDDVYVTMKKMKHLSEREMSLFTLEDFVQIGGAADVPEAVEDLESDVVEMEDDDIETELPVMMTSPSHNGTTFSTNGYHPDDAADE